jgi:hypothetical protein
MAKKTAMKFPQLQPEREISEDDFNLGLNLLEDFHDRCVKRDANFAAVFVFLTAIVEVLTREGNLSIEQLTSNIAHHAAQLQDV